MFAPVSQASGCSWESVASKSGLYLLLLLAYKRFAPDSDEGTLSTMEKSQATFIVDDGNPQALQLIIGSYLKRLRYVALYAQSGLSYVSLLPLQPGDGNI